MIRIENLRKEYDAKTVALDGIDLVFEDSTFVALLGPSGCGKTTTLNCIAGLLEPTSGKIFFGDKDVTQLQPKDRNIGMVFQSYALYPHLKVIDNIAFPLKQKGMKKAERYEKARKIAKMLQIEYLLERKPTQLSGGQQQRVSMARALVKEPDVLLLDEPMSNLDARLKIEIRDEIRRVQHLCLEVLIQRRQVFSVVIHRHHDAHLRHGRLPPARTRRNRGCIPPRHTARWTAPAIPNRAKNRTCPSRPFWADRVPYAAG